MIVKGFFKRNKKFIVIALAAFLLFVSILMWGLNMPPITVLGITLTTLLILCLILCWLLRNPPDSLLENLLQKRISENQDNVRFAEDSLYVITTGTGAPMPDKDRVGPQTIVLAGEKLLVFDAGPGSTRMLEISNLDVGSVDALFLTHYHSDHIGDIGELMLKRWANGSPDFPLPIYGPPGLEKVVNGFEAAYSFDKKYRIDHHGQKIVPASGFGGDSHPFDLGKDLTSSEVVYESVDVQVIAFNVDHTPVFPAVGYRVNYKNRSVVISGDTIFTESLIDHVRGADVLICEALNQKYTDMLANAGRKTGTNLPPIAKDIQTYHITPEKAAMLARDAEVSQLILTHILPPIPSSGIAAQLFQKEARMIHKNLYMANDGTMVKISTETDAITIKEILD
ncbi:MBL fold metallo-hydrolase [bacterium]|nr:MBL fold metallo-hydrolase [bacterium]